MLLPTLQLNDIGAKAFPSETVAMIRSKSDAQLFAAMKRNFHVNCARRWTGANR